MRRIKTVPHGAMAVIFAIAFFITTSPLWSEPPEQPATAPSTQPMFAGGKSYTGTSTPPGTQPADHPTIATPQLGAGVSGGNRPTDIQPGTGIGPSTGDRQPSAAQTPTTPPTTEPTSAK